MTAVMSTRPDRKAATRARILDAAAELFGAHGIAGVGVDAVMHAAGLTHGGFYVHFASKEALAAAVCAEELGRSASRWRATAAAYPPATALSRIVTSYLSLEHARPGGPRGCLLPSLAPELARRGDAAAAAASAMADMAAVLSGLRPGSDGTATLAAMVGALVLARLCDETQATRLLTATRDSILNPT